MEAAGAGGGDDGGRALSVASLHWGVGRDRAEHLVNTLADCDRCVGHRCMSSQ